jgi:hypothetical protein
MAQVITAEDADGRSYVRRAMKKLAELGLAETSGKDGRHPIWNLTPAGQKALADGNELPARPKAGTGAKAVRAGFGPHGVAVPDMILAYGGRKHLTDWQVEVNHAIKETGLSFNTDAVLALPTKTSEVRLFELDNGTMSQARLAKEVWDYERYAGHRVWEGARGTIGNTYPDLPAAARRPGGQGGAPARQPPQGAHRRRPRHRHRGVSEHLPRLKRGEPWYEIGVDDPHRRRERYPEPADR